MFRREDRAADAVVLYYADTFFPSSKGEDVLFIATGALLSTTSVQQGETIPGIAHLVYLSSQAQDEAFPTRERASQFDGRKEKR